MTASVTIGYTSRETRVRTIELGDGQRTVRVRTGRSNTRRQAINESWGNR
ncbi:hypothetical protein ACH4T9_12870 [Micromonospora sp. NPDC020750]